MLLLPLRNFYLSPRKLVSRLRLESHWEVLELGCGPGYFSPCVAKHLPDGFLHLVDVQREMVQRATKRLAKRKITNATASQTDGKTLDFPGGKFDCIYLITVLGEIQEPELMLRELSRVAKSNALLSITEQGGDPDALSFTEVRNLIEPFGFSFECLHGKSRTFTANFRKTK